MNLFEVLAFILIWALAFFFGGVLFENFGTAGWLLGAVVGLLLGFTGIQALRGLASVLDAIWPRRPVCKTGKCMAEDYRYVKSSEDGIIFVCGCGIRYVSSGGKFMELLDDGSRNPFRKRNFLWQWKPDRRRQP